MTKNEKIIITTTDAVENYSILQKNFITSGILSNLIRNHIIKGRLRNKQAALVDVVSLKKFMEYFNKNNGRFSIAIGIKNSAKNPNGIIKKPTKGIATKLANNPTKLKV